MDDDDDTIRYKKTSMTGHHLRVKGFFGPVTRI